MIMRHIDRSRSTGGGMAASFVIHGGLLLLLAAFMGHQAGIIQDGGELTEIAYIEAKYGEDVAAKVKIKEPPRRKPEPPGRGVNTESAMKPKPEAVAEPPRPEPKPAAAPQPKPRLEAPPRLQPAARAQAAEVQVAVPDVQSKGEQKVLAQATTLETKASRPKSRKVIDASKLAGTLKTKTTSDVAGPRAAARKQDDSFKPATTGLKSKAGSVALGDNVVAAAGSSSGNTVSEAPANVASGGSLKSAGRSEYATPTAGLTPAGGSRKASGKGVLDVTGPSGGGGGTKTGRKTILNYGSGGGGRGGALNSRQRIAEPAAEKDIVAQPQADSKPQQAVAEVKLDTKGVNMTITGQIQGRKILKSVAAVYSSQAKKKGWEGVVAVHFTVLADGRVKDNMYFDQTSVHRDLNKAAMAAIKQFRFAPLPSDQAAIEQWGVITIVFRLN